MPVASILSSFLFNKYTLIVTVLLSAYGYYYFTSKKIERLENDNKVLMERSVELLAQQEIIKQNFQKIEVIHKETIELNKKLAKSEEQKKESLFRELKNKKSIEHLALKKTYLVEKAANEGTLQIFNCLEKVTSGETC